MIINGSGYTLSLVPREKIRTFILKGKEYSLETFGHRKRLDGVNPENFIKRLKYNRDLEETKARMNQMLGR